MKIKLFIYVLAVLLVSACGKNEETPVTGTNPAETSPPKTIVSTKEIQIEGSPIKLPIGTKVTPSVDGYELKVELPEGYFFLTENNPAVAMREQDWPLLVYIIASYKCKCSGSSACQVFYQEEAGGFGCLHKSCSGSCTGSFTTLQAAKVTGVLNRNNMEVSARKDKHFRPASLTAEGFDNFFSAPVVQQKIAEQYELLYRNIPKPDFAKLDANKSADENYVYLKANLYGVSFYMVAPKLITDHNDLMETYAKESATCQCDNGQGSCKKKGKGFLGWDVYWCEGDCNACVLTVTDKHYAD